MEEKEKNDRNKFLVIVVSVFFGGMSLLCWGKKENSFSDSERRVLETFPAVTMESIWNGSFMDDFEEAALDQFPFRDQFRSWKALASYGIFQKKDNNKLYVAEGHLAKMEYPMQEKMLENAVLRMEEIYDWYLKETKSKCYFSIVPDKNYYLAQKNGYLSMSYPALFSYMQEKISFAEFLDVRPFLNLEDYYKTDTHWRQEKITDVAAYLKKSMGSISKDASADNQDAEYEIQRWEAPFYGVYYGQAALSVTPDILFYLESDVLRQCRVTSYDNGTAQKSTIYNFEKAAGRDAYEIFLSGASALQVIDNPCALEEKELIVFRDSFGSSLVPLLVDGYSKITVIDTRYVQAKALEKLVDFHGQDVLFLYSTLLLNSSTALR